MLGMKSYERNYVDACRAKIDADVRAFKKSGSKELETTFFNNLVLKLEYMFVHRLTGIEGKDGNPQIDKLPGWPNSAGSGIQLPPDKSVLKLKPAEEIKVSEADFVRLAKAFFAEIEKKYS